MIAMDYQALFDALAIRYNKYFASVINALSRLEKAIRAHVMHKGNPHGTTKADIGLSNVPNYPTGTEQEQAEGKSSTVLSTPAGVQKQIEQQVVTAEGLDELVTGLTNAFNNGADEINQI